MPQLGATAALALGIGALGGQTAVNIYGQRSANKTNQKALEAQQEADRRAADIDAARAKAEQDASERQAAIEREKLSAETAEADKRRAADAARWQDYLRINQPYWQAGAGVLQNLYDIAGMGRAPAQAMPSGDLPPASAGAARPMSETVGHPLIPDMQAARAPRRTFALAPSPAGSGFNLQQLMALAQSTGQPFGSTPVPAGT